MIAASKSDSLRSSPLFKNVGNALSSTNTARFSVDRKGQKPCTTAKHPVSAKIWSHFLGVYIFARALEGINKNRENAGEMQHALFYNYKIVIVFQDQ